MTELSTPPLCVPFTKMAVRGSSTSFGCRASKTRFERAFLGLLLYRSETFFRYRYILTSYVAYLHKVNSALVEGKRKMLLAKHHQRQSSVKRPEPSSNLNLNEIECYCYCYSRILPFQVLFLHDTDSRRCYNQPRPRLVAS